MIFESKSFDWYWRVDSIDTNLSIWSTRWCFVDRHQCFDSDIHLCSIDLSRRALQQSVGTTQTSSRSLRVQSPERALLYKWTFCSSTHCTYSLQVIVIHREIKRHCPGSIPSRFSQPSSHPSLQAKPGNLGQSHHYFLFFLIITVIITY